MAAHHQAEKTKKKNEFLNNADLLAETIKSQEQGRMTENLGKMLLLLCERYRANRVRRANFTNYTFFEDMVGFAMVNLVKNGWQKFDSTKYSNAFAWFTQLVHNSFLQYLNTEKRHRNIRDALLVELGQSPSFKYIEENANKPYTAKTSDDIIDNNKQDETINFFAENKTK